MLRPSPLRASWVYALTLALGALLPPALRADEISLKSLLPQLTDLADMAEFPDPAYTCREASSHDRTPKTPADPKTWFANHDAGNYVRIEQRDGRNEYVMMDVDGPGAIVRFWTPKPLGANPTQELMVYIDGAEKPTFRARMSELFSGTLPGFPRPIVSDSGMGWNLYLPIPYARHCKVASDNKDLFYQIQYRTYPAGTKVVSFAPQQLTDLAEPLKAAASQLSRPAELNAPPAGAQTTPFDVSIAPGASATLGSFTGPSAIRLFRLQWTPTSDRDEPALRALLLQMDFDGQRTVAAPLGDFFGSAPGVNPYDSLPLSVARGGQMDCRWVMPFKASAGVSVVNHGKSAVRLKGQLVTAPYAWTDRTMHFCAKWRIQNDVPTQPPQDWNFMTARGKGVFAGVAFTIDNPLRYWWGEGNEKIYVDGETFPGQFGTGSEDYFGCAWCATAIYSQPYRSQSRCDGPNNYGRTAINRFDILDRIPFTSDFRFDMEVMHWKSCKVNMTALDYWYAAPGGSDGFAALTTEDLTLRPTVPFQILHVKDAIEAEDMKVLEKTGKTQKLEVWGLGNDHCLLWSGQKVGDTLTLGFDVPKAGSYRLGVRFARARAYGSVQLAISGQKAGEPINCFIDTFFPEPMDEIDLGIFELKAGPNQLAITLSGPRDRPGSPQVGFDYLVLRPLQPVK